MREYIHPPFILHTKGRVKAELRRGNGGGKGYDKALHPGRSR